MSSLSSVSSDDRLPEERSRRADRQLRLPGFGIREQRALGDARVLVIGAGGLGSPVLQYLAGAGVGTIGVVDDDVVALSNLHRQVIHRTADVGEPKTDSAARAIGAIDAGIRVDRHPVRLTSANAAGLFAGYDLVVDGSDNFPTRYLVNDAAALAGLPYVWGSVLRFDGQVSVFWSTAPDGRAVDYRDLHPVPPDPADVLTCDEAGVLGPLCGTVGSVMATEAIKLLTGVGEPLLGRVLTVDALTGRWRESAVRRRDDRMPVRELIDYDAFCGIRPAAHEVGVAELDDPRWTAIVDVREGWERDIVHIPGDRPVPLDALLGDPRALGPGPVLVYCKSGARSARAVTALREAGVDAESLRGGVLAWVEERAPEASRY